MELAYSKKRDEVIESSADSHTLAWPELIQIAKRVAHVSRGTCVTVPNDITSMLLTIELSPFYNCPHRHHLQA